MIVKNPIFKIPDSKNSFDYKQGGGEPSFLIDKKDFNQHKKLRTLEINQIIEYTKNNKLTITNPDNYLFFKIELNSKAMSKSSQPSKLLDKFNIDLHSQHEDNIFFASSSANNLTKFKASIEQLDINRDKRDAAYLSAISGLKPIISKDIITDTITDDIHKKWFLYFHDQITEQNAKKINKELIQKFHIDSEFFVSISGAKIIYGSFPSNFLQEISEEINPYNPIQKIEQSLEFKVSEGKILKTPIDSIPYKAPTLDAKVAIIDSGILLAPNLQNLIIGVEDLVNDDTKIDMFHGTLVGSRAIFGNDIEEQIYDSKKLIAKSKILDIRVMRKIGNSMSVDDKELIDGLNKVLQKHHNTIKVYNLSLNNSDYNWHKNYQRNFISKEIDALSYKYNVIFIISAGNHNNFNQNYPDCLIKDESVITPPADSINSIIVGSIADIESSKSIAKENEPSPFSRAGLNGYKKPDLVDYGGNFDKFQNYDGLGVKGFSTERDTLTESIGTSFSAPIVSMKAAQIFAYLESTKLWKEVSINLVKALLLHAANYSLPINSKISEEDKDKLVGFGITDFNRAISCIDSTATYVFTSKLGKIIYDNKNKAHRCLKHKIRFQVPKELEGSTKRIKVKGTLIYTPPVHPTGELDYSLVDIKLNMHLINSNNNLKTAALTNKSNNDYRKRWNPVQSFEKIFTSFKGGEWEIWLDMTARGIADTDNYEQDYALVITIEDVSTDINNRVNLYENIKLNNPEYIQVETVNIEEKQSISI